MVDYDGKRKETELEKLKLEIRKMRRDMLIDAWKVVISAAGVLAGLGTAAKALGWL